MRQPPRHPGLIPGLLLTAVLALVLSLGYGVVALGAAWKNRCALYGPTPAGALISERPVLREERSWWPIGTTCEWPRADGHGTVWGTSGYVELSVATYGLLLTGVAALAVAAVLAWRRGVD